MLLVVVALGIGYVALKSKIPGSETLPTAPRLPAESFDPYLTFWEERSAAVPPELSVGAVTELANECALGAMPPNKPEYLPTDELLRARAGWVCLQGEPTTVPHSECAAPGTNSWRVARGLATVATLQNGHLVGKSLGGHGNEVDGRGGCTNMTPQSRQYNNVMRSQAENYVAGLARANPSIAYFYLVIPVYGTGNYVSDAIWVFIISKSGVETRGPFINEQHHIDWPGERAP